MASGPIKLKVKVKSLSHVWLFATPLTVAYQDPPPMGFSRQEYWSGLPFPSPGDLPDPGIKPRSGLITSWQIEGEKMEVVTDFLFGGSKITADGDWSHEIKRCLLLGRKAMTNLDSILKSIHITLMTKVCLVKAMVFPVVIYGCESWTTKKGEYQRIDAFELWCWRRLLRVPWTERRSNQYILKEISPAYSLEWLMLQLKSNTLATWCEELTPWNRSWCWERLKAGGEGDDRGWDGWMASLTQWTWVWARSRSWW